MKRNINPPENKERFTQMKTRIRNSSHGLLLISLLSVCFALLPRAQAVITDPDETFPAFNTAAGLEALLNLTTGISNTAYGARALKANTTGGSNLGIGGFALISNTSGSMNSAIGNNAMFNNLSGSNNMALGQGALAGNIAGSANTAMGTQAGAGNTTSGIVAIGFQALHGANTGLNTAIGTQAMFSNTTGPFNTAVGFLSLASNTVGDRNTAVGDGAMIGNASGFSNVAVGVSALRNNSSGDNNVAIGHDALVNNNANNQTAVGRLAMASNSTGPENAAVGFRALAANTTSGFSVAVGFQALDAATGGQNTAVGDNASGAVSTGALNTSLGDLAGANVTTASGCVDIGAFTFGENVSNRTHIKNVGQTAQNNGIFVTVDPATNRIGFVNLSSERYKQNIKPMDKVSEAILGLKPITFRYKPGVDATDLPQFGLSAEEVAKANPDLVTYDGEGKPFTVRYDAINNMMLNEFLKEHKRVQQLEATVAQQQKGMEVLTAQLKEQAAQIQRVSAQVEMGKPVPKVVANQ